MRRGIAAVTAGLTLPFLTSAGYEARQAEPVPVIYKMPRHLLEMPERASNPAVTTLLYIVPEGGTKFSLSNGVIVFDGEGGLAEEVVPYVPEEEEVIITASPPKFSF